MARSVPPDHGGRRLVTRTAVFALLTATLVAAGPGSSDAQPRDPEEYARFLERPERTERLQIERVVDSLGLTRGEVVADLGAGSGLFARDIARRVGASGKVYAIDVDEGLLKIVARTAGEQGLANITTLVGGTGDPRLPEPVDLIFICDTLHHIENQAAYLAGLRRFLKPGGRVAIIDFARNWPAGHEPLAFRVEDVERWMTSAGFSRIASHEFLDDNFFFIYR